MPADKQGAKATGICPICGKETAWEENLFRPFCSGRCRTIDLGRWAAEDYRIPGERKTEQGGGEDKKNHSGE